MHSGRVARLLLPDGAVPVNASAFKEAVTHHAVAEQKKDDCQQEYKQEVSSSERGRLWSFRAWRIQWTSHRLTSNHLE
jgi:hypothetical protein